MPKVHIIVDSHNRLVGVFKSEDVDSDITKINVRCAEPMKKPYKGISPAEHKVKELVDGMRRNVSHLKEQIVVDEDYSFHQMKFRANYKD